MDNRDRAKVSKRQIQHTLGGFWYANVVFKQISGQTEAVMPDPRPRRRAALADASV